MGKGQGVDGWEVLEMRNQGLGAKGTRGGEGKGPCPLHSSLLSERPLCGGGEGGRPSRSCLWSGSAEEKPLAPKYAQVRVCAPMGRGGKASGPEEVEGKPLLASNPKRSRANPKFLPQEVVERGVVPQSRGSETFLAGAPRVGERGSFGSVPWG